MHSASIASRRHFLAAAARTAGAAIVLGPSRFLAEPPSPSDQPSVDDWQRTWDAAVAVLAGNLRRAPGYDKPLLFEGSTYHGIWLECGPHEGLVYASLGDVIATPNSGAASGQSNSSQPTPIQAAVNNHMAFFRLQRPDGQFPASIKTTENGFGQIQMVVPIAATALELAHTTRDEAFLSVAYDACSRWDLWLRQYRDTRKTGLVEGFCTYDTGHDNSPRWAGIPNRCPEADARNCPPIASLPRLCPDLSATVFGGRVALAQMAKALGKSAEADRWHNDAESIRQLIIDKLYSPEDAAFYDLDALGKFIRVRSDAISRVLGEHVLNMADRRDKAVFEAVWKRQLHNPAAFWAPYPFPSIAMDDPTFVRPIPRNSWGGASQALTALRAPRWMTHYGKSAELRQLMRQWCAAIARNDDFRQQMDPVSGEFTLPDPGGYSPTALVFLSFARELGFDRHAAA
jgi:hypothetical protein